MSAWLVVASAVFVGALVHGSVGFGINLVAAPVLVLVDPQFIPGALVVVAGVMVVLVYRSERSSVDTRAVAWITGGLLPGSIAGALALRQLSRPALEIAIAIGVLAAVAATAAQPRIPRSRASLSAAGFLSGFAGATAALAGPPVAVLYQAEPPSVLRGTLSGVFIVGTPISVASLFLMGQFGTSDVWRACALVPPTVAGFAASLALAPVCDRYISKTVVLTVSGGGCLLVLARAIL